MLSKWKLILSNWINCYFDESDRKEQCINIESLLYIISHLRDNYNNLDDSKSSFLEVNSIEEFISEKYPELKFENGTVQATNEEDVHVAASLLLFFVCMSSKTMDIKSAMCSQLSVEDQEIILKFSKSLMGCTPISYSDVQAAITEACGQDVATSEAPRPIIADTPPALRSLHGEVRRLKAALEAERFDKNYLQEELARNNLRLENLVKEKEQYKLDIVNLRAKISLCCGQEAQECNEPGSEVSAKLVKQLQETEERLINVQGQLEDSLYERDLFRSKVDELKRERDKWLTTCQEETTRADQLNEKLETERQNVTSLNELLTELRQHNQKNNIDSSLLECDDADASIHSVNHNVSVCSEACAYVVEVQLAEEKAKTAQLKQQIQSLQELLAETTQKYQYEKQLFETNICERKSEILELKYRVNEEIEAKNKATESFNEIVTKLNNDIDELEQKIRTNKERSSQIIDAKIDEIQTLQEEKNSLLQSLSDETAKLENVIKKLTADLEHEKLTRSKIRDNYEKRLMELNEKVLNRNNELVELQNNVIEKSEMIETLKHDLRKQNELNDEMSNKCNNEILKLNEVREVVEHELKQRISEVQQLHFHIEQKNQYIEEVHTKIDQFNAELHDAIQQKAALQTEIENRDANINSLREELKKVHENNTNYIETLKHYLDERAATIKALKMQLQNEIQYKLDIKQEMEEMKSKLSKKIEELNMVVSDLETEKQNNLHALDISEKCLKEENTKNKELEITCNKLKETMKLMQDEININNDRIKILSNKLDEERFVFEEESLEKDSIIEITNQKYLNIKLELANELKLKSNQIACLESEYKKAQETLENNKQAITSLQNDLGHAKAENLQLQNTFDVEKTVLITQLEEIKVNMEVHKKESEISINEKQLEIKNLHMDIDNLKKNIHVERTKISNLELEKQELSHMLEDLEKKYENEIIVLRDTSHKLNREIAIKNDVIINFKSEFQLLTKNMQDNYDELKLSGFNLSQEMQTLIELLNRKNENIKKLSKQVTDLELLKKDLQAELQDVAQKKIDAIEVLNKEIEQLHFTIEEENTNNELFLKEKDLVIEALENKLKKATFDLESIQKEYENEKFIWEKLKIEMKDNLIEKDKKIIKIKDQIQSLENNIERKTYEITEIRKELHKKIEDINKEKDELENKLKTEYMTVKTNLVKEQEQKAIVVAEKEQLNLQIKEDINKLSEENILLTKQLKEQKDQNNLLLIENNNLLHEKSILSQELIEEKSIKKIIEGEKNAIVLEKSNLEALLNTEKTKNQILFLDKERLTQQNFEEKISKDIAIKEKEELLTINKEQEKIITDNSREIKYLESTNNDLKQNLVEKQMLVKTLEANIDKVENELIKLNLVHESVLKEKEKLSAEVTELKYITEVLDNDNKLIGTEKESLVKSLDDEKAARDALENEKNFEINNLFKMNEQYSDEVKTKQIGLNELSTQLINLKNDYKEYKDNNMLLVNVLKNGIKKVIQKLKNEEISNDILNRIIISENEEENIELTDKCKLLMNMADALTNELTLHKNLEIVLKHENSALIDTKKMLEKKEAEINEIRGEAHDLRQQLCTVKSDLENQTETYRTNIETKNTDIAKLQNENTILNNELNDIKIQLEIKIHSLKEKLIDNEILTDKLKQSYESQIENLNVMINKLTCCLKDKTVEIESIQKEKKILTHYVEEKDAEIKLLQEDITTHNQNQNKLKSEFESERLTQNNKMTLIESVANEEKTILLKILAEYSNFNEKLTEEIISLKELLNTEKLKFETITQDKEVVVKSLQENFNSIQNERESALKQSEDKIIRLNDKIKDLTDELLDKNIIVNKIEKEHTIKNELLTEEIKSLKHLIESVKLNFQTSLEDRDIVIKKLQEDLQLIQNEKDSVVEECNDKIVQLNIKIEELSDNLLQKDIIIKNLENKIINFKENIQKYELEITKLKENHNELSLSLETFKTESNKHIIKLMEVLRINDDNSEIQSFKEYSNNNKQLEAITKAIEDIIKVKTVLQKENLDFASQVEKMKVQLDLTVNKDNEELAKLNMDNGHLVKNIEEKKTVINNLEQLIKHELEQNHQLKENARNDKLSLSNKCSLLQENQENAEKQLKEKQIYIDTLVGDCKTLKSSLEKCENMFRQKEETINKIANEKDELISVISKELLEEKTLKEKYQKELEIKLANYYEMKQELEEIKAEKQALEKENELLIKASPQGDIYAVPTYDKIPGHIYACLQTAREHRDHQVDNTSDLTQSSLDSNKTILDLEKIIHDKNRTITTLQSDISYMKTILAESENKYMDVSKDLEISQENVIQLSAQLKKIVQVKNEEIAELKRQVNKMSATENRASQIIKVSAKYQAMILKRIAEIKTNTVLKELTNFGNTTNSDNELRRSLTAGTITMGDLENFLETTDRHLRKCSEKQIALQKERDRLTEVNKIHESEILNMRKFLTEISVSFKTFNSVKELYEQKVTAIVSLQRNVRREILVLEGHITDSAMCKLERAYASVMQDLSECLMHMERWVERCIDRTLSTEKIKQAFSSEADRASLLPVTFQNTGLEVQLEELNNSFHRLLEDISRAKKGEGAKSAQEVTLMDVRAEYEDKLNRMKAKMNQLYKEQIQVYKDDQKREVAALERELQKARDKMEASSREYENHIRALTTELWNVGEKFLMKKDEADWLRRKDRSGSLMSLQHVHSSGLVRPQEEASRPSDTYSLRSLPMNSNMVTNHKNEGRGIPMSDEEGEVFDNRCLAELSTPPARPSHSAQPAAPAGARLSELRWRNSLCPPHLKSSYPAELQFAAALHEEDVKCINAISSGRATRKEVGITAYKKPGPPTPSKQAGRLSATDSELRESLRVEHDPQASRKTSTPSRLRSLFRTSKNDTIEGTPRSKRLSFFRKKQ